MESNHQMLARMKLDIQMRGLSESTRDSYLRYARKFLEHCGKPAEDLDESDIKEYLICLMHEGRLETSSINQYNAAIRFLFAGAPRRLL